MAQIILYFSSYFPKFEPKQQEDSIFINFKVPNKDMDPDDYFDDGIRRIDFILVWKKGKTFPGAMSVGVTIINMTTPNDIYVTHLTSFDP